MKLKTLLIATILAVVGCDGQSPDIAAFDQYCATHNLHYQAWASSGRVYISAWPCAGHWYSWDGFTSTWREYEVGDWLESDTSVKGVVGKVMADIQSGAPRHTETDSSITDIGGR